MLKLTRRRWVAVLGSAAGVARTQTPPPHGRQADGDALAEARAEIVGSLDRIRKVNLPQQVEPALLFKP